MDNTFSQKRTTNASNLPIAIIGILIIVIAIVGGLYFGFKLSGNDLFEKIFPTQNNNNNNNNNNSNNEKTYFKNITGFKYYLNLNRRLLFYIPETLSLVRLSSAQENILISDTETINSIKKDIVNFKYPIGKAFLIVNELTADPDYKSDQNIEVSIENEVVSGKDTKKYIIINKFPTDKFPENYTYEVYSIRLDNSFYTIEVHNSNTDTEKIIESFKLLNAIDTSRLIEFKSTDNLFNIKIHEDWGGIKSSDSYQSYIFVDKSVADTSTIEDILKDSNKIHLTILVNERNPDFPYIPFEGNINIGYIIIDDKFANVYMNYASNDITIVIEEGEYSTQIKFNQNNINVIDSIISTFKILK